jgi:predicted HTH transcriptional regulator
MKLSDTGTMIFRGQTYTFEQMTARVIALEESAKFLLRNSGRLAEAESVATDLAREALEWAGRAERCRNPLTHGQRVTYENLVSYIADHGGSPTMAALAKMEDISSNTVRVRIKALITKGLVNQRPNIPGGLSIAKPGGMASD